MISFIWSWLLITFLERPSDLFYSMGDNGKQELPGNKIRSFVLQFLSIEYSSSWRTQPKLQISTAWSYCYSPAIISGARYHLVQMWFESDLFLFCRELLNNVNFLLITIFISFSVYLSLKLDFKILSRILLEFPEPFPIVLLGRVLERPKSQILTFKSSSTRMLDVFMSRWIMFAEWRCLRAHRVLYRIKVTCSEFRLPPLTLKKVLRSIPKCSITMNKFICPLKVVA